MIGLAVWTAAAQTPGRFHYEMANPPATLTVDVPEEGNYRVTVTLGDPVADSVTTVKAELRRLMLERVRVAAGKTENRSFLVNVRTPQIAGGGAVKLKPRETTSEAIAWDRKLTLSFMDAHPAVRRVVIDKADGVPTLFIVGDSTSTDQPREPFNSWGQMLTRFFGPDIAVANHGESGESLRSFLAENRWAKVLSVIRPGDWVFIQMGHNDQKERGDGVGAFTTYAADLTRLVRDTRGHGATPVLLTSMHRLSFAPGSGEIVNTLGDYPEAVRRVAKAENVALIDLNLMSKPFYEALGPRDAHLAFAGDDKTHHSDYGSYELAKCIVQGIQDADLPIAKYLYEVAAFDPAHPDPYDRFDVPAEPQKTAERPYGDVPTVWVVGDSTANNAGHRGWGDPFAAYFDASKMKVANRAMAGRSSRTFFTEGRWDRVRAELKPGDFVLIQFGHNDGSAPDKDRARGSLPGLGEESQEFTLPDGRHETVYTFGWYMRKFIADTKAAGATPIVLSLTVRNIWASARVERGPGNFPRWSAEVAKQQGVTFLDVTNAIADRYDNMGEAKVRPLFPEDHTHTSPEGADLNASLVVACIKGAKIAPLVAALSAKAEAVEPYPIPPAQDQTARLHLPEPANPALPTVFLIGDSTVRNGRGDGSNGQWGWGEPIVDRFDTSKINVVNRAVGGLSSRTYLTQGHWDRVLAMLKRGDFVIMQFGHNDSGPLDDAARARGTIKGTGEETREIDNPITKQHEVVHSYGWYLRKFIADAKARGAVPIVCSPIPRKIWKDGKIGRDPYGKWAADVAAAEGVAFVDLNEIIAVRYEALGPEKVEALFGDEHTHTSRAGAELNADCVIAGLRALSPDPLADYLK